MLAGVGCFWMFLDTFGMSWILLDTPECCWVLLVPACAWMFLDVPTLLDAPRLGSHAAPLSNDQHHDCHVPE